MSTATLDRVAVGVADGGLTALGEHIIIQRDPAVAITKGGIAVPTTAQDRPSRGTIQSVGCEVKNMNLQPGVRVLYSKYAGTLIEVGDDDLLIAKEADLLAIVNDE